MKWLWGEEAGSWYSDDGKWDILPCGEVPPTFMLRHNVGDDANPCWEATPMPYATPELAQAAADEATVYANGRAAGEEWANATGTTEAALSMVPVLKGSAVYRIGFRQGAAKVRRLRHLAENNIPDHSDRPLFECRNPQCERKV